MPLDSSWGVGEVECIHCQKLWILRVYFREGDGLTIIPMGFPQLLPLFIQLLISGTPSFLSCFMLGMVFHILQEMRMQCVGIEWSFLIDFPSGLVDKGAVVLVVVLPCCDHTIK
jgi:hypothetical protein